MIRTLPLRTWLIIGAVVLIVVLFLGWRCSADRARNARADANVAGAQADLGQDAAEITAGVTRSERENEALTRENRDDIMETENANEDAGAAGDAGLAALCRRRVYRDQPQCAGLRQPDRPGA